MSEQTVGSGAEGVPTWKTQLVEVADDVFAYIQAGGGYCIANAGLISATTELTAVDALFTPAMTRAFLAQANRVSSQPLRRLINTHHHADHTFGNQFFAGAEIIAHVRARSEMQRVGVPTERILQTAPQFEGELGEVTLTLPTLTFNRRMTVYYAKRRVELIHLGPAHTLGDTLVYLPEQRLLFAGDVAFFYVTPLGFEGNISGWIDVAGEILSMDVDTIVPGHGPIGGKAELQLMCDYLIRIRDQARQAYDNGVSEEAAAAAIDLGPYAAWTEPERVLPNTRRLYQEFRGELG